MMVIWLVNNCVTEVNPIIKQDKLPLRYINFSFILSKNFSTSAHANV